MFPKLAKPKRAAAVSLVNGLSTEALERHRCGVHQRVTQPKSLTFSELSLRAVAMNITRTIPSHDDKGQSTVGESFYQAAALSIYRQQGDPHYADSIKVTENVGNYPVPVCISAGEWRATSFDALAGLLHLLRLLRLLRCLLRLRAFAS